MRSEMRNAERAFTVQSSRRSQNEGAKSRTDVCHGVCRSCSRRRQLFLPARICGRCIEGILAMSRDNRDSLAAPSHNPLANEPNL